MKLSVIIPNYNGVNLLKENLPKVVDRIQEEQTEKAEIIVIDDASTDKSWEFLQVFKEKFSSKKIDLIILQNSRNLGFSKIVNKAVSQASGDILLLFNTDVYPQKGFLKPLLSHFDTEGIFAAGCLDKSIENGKTILRGRGLGSWRRGFLVHYRGETDQSNTLWVNGGSGAFRKEIWEKLSGFNNIYSPFYWEDIDLSYRALKSGYEILFENKSIVVHEHEKGSILATSKPAKVKTVAYRNQFIFVWENATDFDIIIAHVLWLPYHIIKTLMRGDVYFLMGFIWAIFLLPEILAQRIKNKRTFTKSDKEVIRNL